MKRFYIVTPFLLSAYCLLLSATSKAQTGVNYNDVAVIVNMNSDSSQIIANYFMAKRNIPAANLIRVHTSTDEEISESVFTNYMNEIKDSIAANIPGQLNYIVTTKGCPLKVLRVANDVTNCNSSCESELMLLANFSSEIGNCIPTDSLGTFHYFLNRYFSINLNFKRSFWGQYLVTRLDGYTTNDVLSLIDRSGPNQYVNKDSVLFVLDMSPNFSSSHINEFLVKAADTLMDKGWKVNLSTDSVYLTNQSKVLGYYSWGSNDGFSHHYTQNAIPHNTWVNGSIAETGVSTSGRSLQPGTLYGQSLAADWIHEGSTGMKGYVYEPFTIAIAFPDILFERYTRLKGDGSPTFNLAESYFGASLMIGWMDVVIGDPKTSITTDHAYSGVASINKNNSLEIFPNPARQSIYINCPEKTSGKTRISFFDLSGRMVLSETTSEDHSHKEINVESLTAGMYFIQLLDAKGIVAGGKFVKE